MEGTFVEGLVKASTMILVSEIGDKTFFVAALMAMRHPRRHVLAGSLAALWLMTSLSAAFGWAAPSLLPRQWTHVLATLLFFGFGCHALYDGLVNMRHDGGDSRAEEEMKEVEKELETADVDEDEDDDNNNDGASGESKDTGLRKRSAAVAPQPPQTADSTPTMNGKHVSATHTSHTHAGQPGHKSIVRAFLRRCFSPVFIKTFSLVFLGEWGDKSQIATVGLATEDNVWGVALGGCIGHMICSGAAVVGGRHLATRISERLVAIIGGVLFLGFAAHSLIIHGAGLEIIAQ